MKPVVASLDIPANASTVDLWFASNNRWGCIAYDSNMGANYHFEIERGGRGAILSFDADQRESQSEAIHAGDSSSCTTSRLASSSAVPRALVARAGASRRTTGSMAVR